MTKKFLCLALTAWLLLACLAACADNTPPTDDTPAESDSQSTSDGGANDSHSGNGEQSGGEQSGEQNNGEQSGEEGGETGGEKDEALSLNGSSDFVTLFGERTVATDSGIICDWSGSGIEFSLYNASDAITVSVETSGACRFLVYVDGVEQTNILGGRYFEVNGRGMIPLGGLANGKLTVKIIKVTDASNATATFKSVLCKGVTVPVTDSDAELYFEFLGNGACAGEGLSGTSGTVYADVDVTGSYAYLTAKEYGADYSILADPTLAFCGEVDASTLYNRLSYKRDDTAYGFARTADAVIVDLGAVDYAKSLEDTAVNAESFAEKYRALLENIKEKNGEECKIICVYDVAFGSFSEAVTGICRELGGSASGYYTCARNSIDGAMSAQEHTDFTAALRTVVDAALNGEIIESGMKSESSGSGITVSYNDFKPYS